MTRFDSGRHNTKLARGLGVGCSWMATAPLQRHLPQGCSKPCQELCKYSREAWQLEKTIIVWNNWAANCSCADVIHLMFLPWKASMSGKTAPLQSQCACPVTLECSTQEHQEHCLRKNKQLNLAIRRHWYKQGIQTILSYSQKKIKPFSHTLRKFICKTFKSEPLLLDFHIKRTLILSAHWSLLKFLETLSRASKGSFMDVHFLAFLALFFLSLLFRKTGHFRIWSCVYGATLSCFFCLRFQPHLHLSSVLPQDHTTLQPSNPPALHLGSLHPKPVCNQYISIPFTVIPASLLPCFLPSFLASFLPSSDSLTI